MKISDLREQFPKGVASLTDWLGGNLNKEYEKMQAEVELQDNINNLIELLLMYNPRELFDFFDYKGINIAIIPPIEKEDTWIHWNSKVEISLPATSRLLAEEAAFVDAFKQLERAL